MPRPRVSVSHDFSLPPERVYAFLAEHENLAQIFPARIERLTDGTDGKRNGPGSSRRLTMAPGMRIVETTTATVENERIEYRITDASLPVKHHRGTMVFSSLPSGGTHLQYDIELELPVPGAAALVAKVLDRSIRKGLPKVDRLA